MNNNFEENNIQAETPVEEVSTLECDVETAEVIEEVEVPQKKNIVFGIISLVCGALAVCLFCCCYGVLAFPLGVAGLVLAFFDKKKNGKFSALGLAGLIASGVGIGLVACLWAYYIIVWCFSIFMGIIESL